MPGTSGYVSDVPVAGSRSGRHRAPSASGVPRLAGTGLILPTAAAATIVLTTTGAHLGSPTTPTANLSSVGIVEATAKSTTPLAEQQEVQDLKASALAAQARTTQQRADRDRARARSVAIAQQQAQQAAAAKAAAAKAVADAKAAQASAHRWVPFLDASYTLTSGFGMRWGSMHPGQDFAVPVGTPIKAMSSGTVIFAGWSGGYGNKVEVKYWDGTISWFAHNSQLKVTEGEAVTPGEVVALSGNTGHSTGPHSHVEIHLGGDDTSASATPPLPWLNKMGIMPGSATGRTGVTAGE